MKGDATLIYPKLCLHFIRAHCDLCERC